MDSDPVWIVASIDNKIAAVSNDYRKFAHLLDMIKDAVPGSYRDIRCLCADFDFVWNLRQTAKWEDFFLLGTSFQKNVWKVLFEFGKSVRDSLAQTNRMKLISYSDFAGLCGNRAGVRAVAHAIGLNPVPVIIPCHLVIPKESVDKIKEIEKEAEVTLFRKDGIDFFKSVDFGEYALGREMKRELIAAESNMH